MTQEILKEAKNFRRQMKWCSILCWVATLAFIFMPKNPKAGDDWLIVPAASVILTIIYFNMNNMINKYENEVSRRNS